MNKDEYAFPDDFPQRLTVTDFKRYFIDAFPVLVNVKYDIIVESSIEDIYTMFYGVQQLWDFLDKDVYYEKTRLCYRLLVAWYIADVYPFLLAGSSLPTIGGIAVKRKKIGGVDITFADAIKGDSDLMRQLGSNPYGNKARLMLSSAAKKYMVRGAKLT